MPVEPVRAGLGGLFASLWYQSAMLSRQPSILSAAAAHRQDRTEIQGLPLLPASGWSHCHCRRALSSQDRLRNLGFKAGCLTAMLPARRKTNDLRYRMAEPAWSFDYTSCVLSSVFSTYACSRPTRRLCRKVRSISLACSRQLIISGRRHTWRGFDSRSGGKTRAAGVD